MPDTFVHVDRIELEVRGMSVAVAQSALASFGPALEHALVAHSIGRSAPAAARLDRIDAGNLRLSLGASRESLRHALAQRVASTVARQLGPTKAL